MSIELPIKSSLEDHMQLPVDELLLLLARRVARLQYSIDIANSVKTSASIKSFMKTLVIPREQELVRMALVATQLRVQPMVMRVGKFSGLN